MAFKFRFPENGQFRHYCGDCKYFSFERQIGCENLGVCNAIKDEPTNTEAYQGMCGLWEKKGGGKR